MKKFEYNDKKLKKLMLGGESVRIHQHWWRRSKKKAGSQDHNASQCSPSSASCLSYQTSSPPHPHPAPLKSSSQPSQALPSRRPTPPGAFLPHLLLLPPPFLHAPYLHINGTRSPWSCFCLSATTFVRIALLLILSHIGYFAQEVVSSKSCLERGRVRKDSLNTSTRLP